MIHRNITSHVLEALEDTPVLFLTGARQTGKSTLVSFLAENKIRAESVTLDDMNILSAVKQDPSGFVAGLTDTVIIDEVQRAPELLLAIKASVDKNRKPGRFLLTGSSNVLTLPRIADSLAGRVEIQYLWPFSQGELRGHKETFIDKAFSIGETFAPGKSMSRESLWRDMVNGGYPVPLQRKNRQRRDAWYKSYITTILQRDIRDLAHIEGLTVIPNILKILAGRCANLVNFADIARSLQLPQSTLKRYTSLLESVFLVHRLLPWSGNFGNRLLRTPKIYMNDTGLLCFLLGIDVEGILNDPTLAGHIVENFVVNELVKQSTWSFAQPGLFHLRTHSGLEIDVVLESRQGTYVAVEVKASNRIDTKALHGIRAFRDTMEKKFVRGIVLYTGNDVIGFDHNIHAVPIHALCA